MVFDVYLQVFPLKGRSSDEYISDLSNSFAA